MNSESGVLLLDRQFEVQQERILVELKGCMYEDHAALLGQELSNYVSRGYNTYIIDMSSLDYIDSSGIGVLMAINKLSQRSGGSVTLQGLKGTVRELFEITHLNKVFKLQQVSC